MTIKELPMIHIRIFWIFMRVRKTSRKDPSLKIWLRETVRAAKSPLSLK